MSFLTAGILRHPAPTAADIIMPSDPGCTTQDKDCGTPQDDGIDQDCGKGPAGNKNKDNDCSASSHDNDCSKANGGGGYHKDNNCAVGGTDSSCGSITGNGGETNSDSDCSSTSADGDCGGNKSTTSTFAGHSDECCTPGGGPPVSGSNFDSDCGVAGVGQTLGGWGEDSDCGTSNAQDSNCGLGIVGASSADDDCHQLTDQDCAQLFHTDSDCPTTGQDGDCWPSPGEGADLPNWP